MILSILGMLEIIVNNLKSPAIFQKKNIHNQTGLLKPIKIVYNEKKIYQIDRNSKVSTRDFFNAKYTFVGQ